MVIFGSAWRKDLFREIRRSWPRFVSICAIVLLGVAFFAGIKATAPDMRNTADRYFDDYNLMDIRVLSTLGLTPDDLNAIRTVPGVESASPAYFTDAVCAVNSTEFVFRIHSLQAGGQTVNGFRLTAGRLPEKSGECLVEDSKNLDIGMKIGDTLQMGSGTDTPIVGNALKRDTYTIVGKAVSPYYLSFDKGPSDIGNGKAAFFMMIPEADFAYPVYTEALVTVRGAKQLNCYGKAYKDLIARIIAEIDNIGADRSDIRLEEVKAPAQAQLDDARKEYDAKKKEFDDKMDATQEQLSKSRMDLGSSEAALDADKENAKTQEAQAQQQIDDNKARLVQGEKEYQQELSDYNRAKSEYGDAITQMNSAVTELESARSAAKSAVGDIETLLQDPSLSDSERTQLTQLLSLSNDFLNATNDSMSSLNEANSAIQSQLSSARARLRQARQELDDADAQIAAAQKKLADGTQEANDKFAQADLQIQNGWMQYNDGMAEYQKAKKQGEEELAAGQDKIEKAQDEIERISKPQWYVLDRSTNISYADFSMTADRIDAIASAFPIFFFLVAALVCLTTMTRMVDEQRGVIGIYKALGYPDGATAFKYVAYAAAACVLGSAAGLAVGVTVFPQVIYQSWLMKYEMPALQPVPQVWLMLLSFVMGLVVTALTAWAACRRELRDAPSQLMRPKAPKPGKRIFLERIKFLWKSLTFSQKVTARNLFRYKKRFLMTVIGIAGCTALLLAGFGLNDSIGRVVDRQFRQIFTYNIDMRFKADAGADAKQRVEGLLSGNTSVSAHLSSAEVNAKTRSSGDDIAVTLVVPSDTAELGKYVTLRNAGTGQPVNLGASGAVITQKLAKELGVGPGDTIELDNGITRKKVQISDIVENYIFHYVYMSADAYKSTFHLGADFNCVMVKLADDSTKAEDAMAQQLISDGSVASVTFYSSLASTFRQTVKSLDTVILVIILCAGLLAFVVLYNLTNINIGERIREIATVKVLGFRNREVSAYVFRENVILAIIGVIIGLPLGVLLHSYIMATLEQPGIMFGHFISWMSYLWSVLITAGFTGVVILVMGFRLKSIPMVESLKSVE